jgi:hypothetical protein
MMLPLSIVDHYRRMETIRLARCLDSDKNADLLHDLFSQLRQHVKVSAVRDFLERAREFVQV